MMRTSSQKVAGKAQRRTARAPRLKHKLAVRSQLTVRIPNVSCHAPSLPSQRRMLPVRPRRALAALLGRLGGTIPPAFRVTRWLPPGPPAAGLPARGGVGDLPGPVLDSVAGLAASQVHAAVTGQPEDAAGQMTDAIRMGTQQVWTVRLGRALAALMGLYAGAVPPAFARPLPPGPTAGARARGCKHASSKHSRSGVTESRTPPWPRTQA